MCKFLCETRQKINIYWRSWSHFGVWHQNPLSGSPPWLRRLSVPLHWIYALYTIWPLNYSTIIQCLVSGDDSRFCDISSNHASPYVLMSWVPKQQLLCQKKSPILRLSGPGFFLRNGVVWLTTWNEFEPTLVGLRKLRVVRPPKSGYKLISRYGSDPPPP